MGEEPDLGQAVQHHAVGTYLLEGFEDAFGGLAEFEIRGIEQALLPVLVKQTLRWDEFEDIDAG